MAKRVLVGAVGSAVGVVLLASAAAADPATDVLNETNAVRASNGLAPLAADGQLDGVASSWSQNMGGSGTLAHNPSLASQTSGWRKLGENVGTGSDIGSIEQGFEASPEHRANILDPEFRSVGIGVAQSGSTYWVTVDFKE